MLPTLFAVPAAASRPPHVLYVAWGFPPSRGSGVYRALATANMLVDLGCQVTVITADRQTFVRSTGVDETLEALVHPSIDVVRVDFEWPHFQREIDQWPRERAQDPAGWLETWNAAAVAPFPEVRYGAWFPRISAAAEKVHADRPVDLVIATANPNVDCAVGLHLFEKHGVPYVTDQRDGWCLNPLTENVDFPEGTPTADMEKRLIGSALESWFVNEPIRQWHEGAYPESAEKLQVVMNGYDPNTAPTPRLSPADPDAPLTVGYVGTVTPHVPLAEALEGWFDARERDPRVRSARLELYGHLGHFAQSNPVAQTLLDSAASEGVSYGGAVGKARLREIYDRFDVLLFATGGGKYVTTGKVFEYMATGLPIVSCHVPEMAGVDVLRGYPLWFPVADLSPESLGSALAQACEAAVTADRATRERCIEHAATYERNRQLRGPLERVLAKAGVTR